ncbi:MAG: GspE/PulE family protein [bacterium]
MHISNEKLRSLLLASDVITESVFDSAMEEGKRFGQDIVSVLLGRQDITENFLAEILQPYFGVQIVDLRKLVLIPEVVLKIPETIAKTKGVVLYEIDEKEGVAKVAMVDPFDFETIEFLRAKLKMWVDVALTTPGSIKYGLKMYGKHIGVDFNQLIEENIKKTLSLTGEANLSKLAEAVPIVNILDTIIEQAAMVNASDIHFEPLPKLVLVRYRVDGVLHEILTPPSVIAPMLVARVKVLTAMQIDEHRMPQDGRFRFEIEGGSVIDLRVNIMPILHGEKVEMRLLKSAQRPLSLNELGLSDEDTETLKIEIQKPHGMLLVTGPTGHGKTTTLYTVLHMLNTPEVNITTIEDPVEYEIPRVNQTQVNVKAGITFGNGLRALLRQNPDIIMVGEIRDNETVEISVQAALTGHLVLSTLHTNDAPGALPRLLDMGAPAFLLTSTLNCVIAQRLVRRICQSCIYSFTMPIAARKNIEKQLTSQDIIHGAVNLPQTLYKGKGCKLCGNSGYVGQIGIYELLRVNDAIRTLILKSAPISDIRTQAIKNGMVTMFEDGMKKVERGIVTLEEVLRVVRE